MEGGTLFNPGFLGEHFKWWIGQIVDDSTWRDNNLSGKFKDKHTVPGWGKRYKVRIIGLHDREEETISSDQLPWAQVMYPVTAGGGQTNASQTANLRQGMFVFGFFLDGQDQQIPVIMGVLGNNTQTALNTNWKDNFAGTSGYATGKNPPPENARPRVPDQGKVIVKPKRQDQIVDSIIASPGPNAVLDKYGIPYDLRSDAILADLQSGISQATQKGLIGEEFDEFVKNIVQTGVKNRNQFANSPGSPSQPGAVEESAGDAIHKINAADIKREEKYQEKIPLMKPDDKVGSAIRCIQVVLDNLMQKINKYISAISSYADAVSNTIKSLVDLISKAACEIAKYMKIIFDKIMEYVLKMLNKELAKVVSAIPSSTRYMFADMKEIITELILCLYNKITNGLCGLIEGLLNQVIQPQKIEQEARAIADNPSNISTTPNVPICYAEVIVGQAIAYNQSQIDQANNTLLQNINAFIEDIQNQVAGVTSSLPDITTLLGDVNGSMSSALSFENLSLDLFGCELKPNTAVSDYYTFARGGSAQPDSQVPLAQGVHKAVSEGQANIPAVQQIGFADIPSSQSDVVF